MKSIPTFCVIIKIIIIICMVFADEVDAIDIFTQNANKSVEKIKKTKQSSDAKGRNCI